MKRLLPVIVLTAASSLAGGFQWIAFKLEVLFW
jgi:hypothetical protein